ncbi:MAG TPA: exosortase-associated EpsI family protein, partial [Stellaceae bacterium]|nr:exosortase-associated EpsI family protein [Stellaceae bacterium]
SGLLRAKLLQVRAVLLHHAPLAAFVAVSATMDDPDDRAAAQLERFLRATEPLPKFIKAVAKGRGSAPVASRGVN